MRDNYNLAGRLLKWNDEEVSVVDLQDGCVILVNALNPEVTDSVVLAEAEGWYPNDPGQNSALVVVCVSPCDLYLLSCCNLCCGCKVLVDLILDALELCFFGKVINFFHHFISLVRRF